MNRSVIDGTCHLDLCTLNIYESMVNFRAFHVYVTYVYEMVN